MPADWLFTGLDTLGSAEAPPAERVSEASLALIRAPGSGTEAPWLMQWNTKWQAMHWIGGHKERDDPSDLACVLREVHEELFGDPAPSQLERMRTAINGKAEYDPSTCPWADPFIASVRRSDSPPHDFPEYVDFSTGFRKWTRYRLKVYQVTLTARGQRELFRGDAFCSSPPQSELESPNEWVWAADVARGWTPLGRPISPSARRLLRGL